VTKSRVRAAIARGNALISAGLFWTAVVRTRWGINPNLGFEDLVALRDIVLVQSGGNERQALDLIVEIRDVAGGVLASTSLHESWMRLCWWYGCGKPRRPRPLTEAARSELTAAINRNACTVRPGIRRRS
jgi:hypothetical protein